jgi:phage terminase large subunit
VSDDRPVLFQPFPGFQRSVLADRSDELLIGGAKGSGKSVLSVVKPLYQVHKSAFKALILRRTYMELQELLDRASAIYKGLPRSKRPSWNGEQMRFTFPSGARVRFGYCRNLADVQAYHGGEWANITYDEVGNQPDPAVIDRLIAEIRCPDPTVWRQFMGSANPGGAGHGMLVRRFITPCGKQGERLHWTSLDVPGHGDTLLSRRFIPGRVTDNAVYANDPKYLATLIGLPDRLYRMLFLGDWDAATGLAFDELDEATHLVTPFTCPDHWPYVAAFDWGFSHNAVLMWGRVSDDGRVYICDTIKRRQLRDWDLAHAIAERVPEQALRVVQAGHDCWAEHKARGDSTPTTAETFRTLKNIGLAKANLDRVQGYRNLQMYFGWRETEYLPQRTPMLQFFDTPGNRWAFEQLSSLVTDPDDPSDVLKVDADENGQGGDDAYDTIRYLASARPLKAESLLPYQEMRAWHPAMLRADAERRRHRSTPLREREAPYLGV